MFDIVINQGIIITSETDYQPQLGNIGIKDGKIAYVGAAPLPISEGTELIDATDKVIMPGMFNGHCHGDMTILRGLLDHLTLLEQNQVMKASAWLKDYLTEEDRTLSRQLTYLEAIKSGTTFIMENMYWGLGLASIDIMKKTGISGALAQGIRINFNIQRQYVPETYLREFGTYAIKNGLIPVLATVAEEDFDADVLSDITGIAHKLGWFTTQHLAETMWRQDHVNKQFGTTSIRYLAENGFLHSKIIGSHVVYADPEEIVLMKKYGVRVVNTPLCEAKIADGLAPIPAYLAAGIPVGLGTDGALWNNSNDIFREMKGICLMHSLNSGVRSISHKDALNMATIGGASVFGLEDVTGSIQVGKRADLILVDTRTPHLRPIRLGIYENVSSSMVYNATGSDVTDSIIAGRLVMRNRTVLTMDEQDLLKRVQSASEKLLERCLAAGVLKREEWGSSNAAAERYDKTGFRTV